MADPRVRRHLQQGIKLHQSGQLAEADTHYRKVLAIEPNNPDALHMSGVVALQLGKHERALALIVRARNGYPRMAELHNHLGMAQRGLGRSDEALASFRTALLLNPRLMDAHANLVELMADRGALQEAVAQAQHALRIDPQHVSGYNSLGNVLQRLQRYSEAVTSYQQGLTIHPSSALLHQNLGNALRELKDYASAAAAYRQAMALEPRDHRVCLLLGATLERLGQPEAAEEAYREALRRRPGWTEAGFFLSALRSKSSDGGAPVTAPAEYVAQLFDGYASSFEHHLVTKLQYRAPQLLFDAIRPHLPTSLSQIIDLGCGTGLLGTLLRPFAAKLVGVDLSAQMLAEAKQRKIYDQLEQTDLVAALAKHDADYDAVLAADVLVYVGDLEPLYRAAAKALRPGGLLAFTVEENRDDSSFRLQPSRRYAHAAAYLRQLAAEHGFVELSLTTDVLRQQTGQAISGHIAVFHRSS